jgi:predicted transposase YbfD/YdcC
MPDFRKARGKRHPLPAILAPVCAAVLCGYRSYGAIAEWGRVYGADLVVALGFATARTPCVATLHAILRRLDREQVEAKLATWAEGLLRALPPPADGPEAVACDGKALRGSQGQGALDAHLLSALSQRLGITLARCAVSDKANEIPAALALLRMLVIEGRVFTVDALLAQRRIAQAIVDGEGDYIMVVKDTQPGLRADIALVFAEPDLHRATFQQAETADRGHGRVERRALISGTALLGYLDWPGHAQVFALTRTRTLVRTGRTSTETVHGVTSLPRERADAGTPLRLTRQHWAIENRSHHVRDTTFAEDHSQVRRGNVPHLLAAFRNLAVGLIRATGQTNVAAACRAYAARPRQALARLGIPDF